MAYLDITHLEKSFGPNRVVKDFNLGIEKGEFISLLGPSGCGKTTVLRMVAGFETPSSGNISIEGQDILGIPPARRKIGMVFQSYALFPNLTVAQNVAFGLKVAGVGRAESDARVAEMLGIIGLPDLGQRYPFQLSGGQQQRVALARALAIQPRVLLLDEPLSALDAKIRVSLRNEIREIQQRLGITTIFVTHDQEEALSMSDRIVVMHDGIAEQVGSPFEIYNQPSSRFVANFVGTLNVIEGIVSDAAKGSIRVGESNLHLKRKLSGLSKESPVSLALRPEVLSLTPEPRKDANISGKITDLNFLGSVIRIKVEIGTSMILIDMFNSPNTKPPAIGDKVKLHFASSDILVLND